MNSSIIHHALFLRPMAIRCSKVCKSSSTSYSAYLTLLGALNNMVTVSDIFTEILSESNSVRSMIPKFATAASGEQEIV